MIFPRASEIFPEVLPLWNITTSGLPTLPYYLADTLEQESQSAPDNPSLAKLIEMRDFAILRTRGTAASNREMRELETWMADQIVASDLDQHTASDLLIVDGSLMFPFRVSRRRESWKRVIGVSKTFGFTPLVYQRDSGDNVGINLMDSLQHLSETERTRAFYILNDNQIAWYLRLHDQHTPTRYGGIIKVEMTSMVVEDHPGFATLEAFIDAISAELLRIRFPTAPRSNRWDTHLYPVYLAERSLKASMPSQEKIVHSWKHLF